MPHPWPDIFKKTDKDGMDTTRTRSNHQSPRTPTGGCEGSRTGVSAVSIRSDTTTKPLLTKPSTSTSSELRKTVLLADVATTETDDVAVTSSMLSVGKVDSIDKIDSNTAV